MKNYYVYIVECRDNTFYTGWTVNIEKRLECHNQGRGSKYTRSRLPVQLRYLERVASKREACQKEYRIKRLSKTEKEKLIREKGLAREEF
jgi:putative endonuclease